MKSIFPHSLLLYNIISTIRKQWEKICMLKRLIDVLFIQVNKLINLTGIWTHSWIFQTFNYKILGNVYLIQNIWWKIVMEYMTSRIFDTDECTILMTSSKVMKMEVTNKYSNCFDTDSSLIFKLYSLKEFPLFWKLSICLCNVKWIMSIMM